MIIPMLCVTIFVILVVWFLLPRVARLMIHTPTAISIFVCLSMVQQIGRASCRERVEVPVVAAAFKNKGNVRRSESDKDMSQVELQCRPCHVVSHVWTVCKIGLE